MTEWFQPYKDTVKAYLNLFLEEDDIGRDITYKAYLSSSFNSTTREQDYTYTEYDIRAIKADSEAEALLGPLWLGIKNYRSQASASIQTGDFQYILSVDDFPAAFEPTTKDQIVDSDDIIKVIKPNRIFGIAFLIVGEGSNVT